MGSNRSPKTSVKLIAEFEIKGLPKTTNTLNRMHWAKKSKEANMWKQIVGLHCRQLKVCDLRLTKATLELTRYSSIEPDFDGLVSTWKHLVDGLVVAGVLIDDKQSVIGSPIFKWEKCKKNEGRVKIRVFDLQESLEPHG
jgi:hypothetical protein